MHTDDLLLRYADLRIKDLEALRHLASAHPAIPEQLGRNGLLMDGNVHATVGVNAFHNAQRQERSGPPPENEAAVRTLTWAGLESLSPTYNLGRQVLAPSLPGSWPQLQLALLPVRSLATNRRMIEEEGVEHYLVNLPCILRETFGYPPGIDPTDAPVLKEE